MVNLRDRTRRNLYLIGVLLILGACSRQVIPSTPAPTREQPRATPDNLPAVVISEVLAGIPGNNDHEFIELYNPDPQEPVNLEGMTLWYQLEEGQEERILYRWTEKALVPPQGHYLLGRSDQAYQVVLDRVYDLPLATSRGGLLLRADDDTPVDSLSWGDDPQEYGEGAPAPAMARGVSLERLPGGELGSTQDSGDNRADFQLLTDPHPESSGSPPAPVREHHLAISVSAPEAVEPGGTFCYTLELSNLSGRDLGTLRADIPLPDRLMILDAGPGLTAEGDGLYWEVGALKDGDSIQTEVQVQAPWTYLTLVVDNYLLQAEDWPVPALGGPVRTEVKGGSIPVERARSLLGEEVVVQGVATMYTGGYFAGSGNTKFYLEDETGGIQVWVPEGAGEVEVEVGDKVTARGVPELYRGAVELVVNDPDHVQVSAGGPGPEPLDLAVEDVLGGKEELPGRLVEVEGEISRVEEFSYSYEIDLVDPTGQTLTLYVDKNTSLNVEALETGDFYRAAGILEVRDGVLQLYPRLPVDLERVYPAELRLTREVPNTAAVGQPFSLTLAVHNHTDQDMTGVEVEFLVPENARVVEVQDAGERVEDRLIRWEVGKLTPGGGRARVGLRMEMTAGEYLTLDGSRATSDQWDQPAEVDLGYVFAGERIPVWALQGPGFRSPYLLEEVRTAGVITGVFPELGGFWIQETFSDRDPSTSPGLFIHTGTLPLDYSPGDVVEISGLVRETYQQTQLKLGDLSSVRVIRKGASLPPALAVDPPADGEEAEVYWEAREGRRVQVPGTGTVVAPSSQYGEYVLVLSKHGIDRLWTRDHSGLGIMVDDGSEGSFEYRSELPYAVKVGDRVTGVVGPLAYTFGRYKIEPTSLPVVTAFEEELPSVPNLEGRFSIATWNVENLFDIVLPHPSDPDLPTVQEYRTDLEKVAHTILAAGSPSVIGLQEVENLGILEDLAAGEILEPFDYQPYLVEGTDSRGIDVGYLIRGENVRVREVRGFPAPEGLTSRPPLLVHLEVDQGDSTAQLLILNNHFTSMSGGEAATEPRRTAQALWNTEILGELREEFPQAYQVVIGDLNSYYHSPPLEVLREAGLDLVLEEVPEAERYTYIYQGGSQVLDYILVDPRLRERLVSVEILHTNADYPLPLSGDPSPLRKSDHDLVLAAFDWGD